MFKFIKSILLITFSISTIGCTVHKVPNTNVGSDNVNMHSTATPIVSAPIVSTEVPSVNTTRNDVYSISNNVKDNTYDNLKQSMPYSIHLTTNMIAMVQNDKLSMNEALNPADPNFADCMQKAIEVKFYERAFNEAYDNYISTVSPQDFINDKIFINHPDTIFNNALYIDVFAKLARNDTKEKNYQLFQQLREQSNDYSNIDELFDGLSQTYYQNFGTKSQLFDVIGEQIAQCLPAKQNN